MRLLGEHWEGDVRVRMYDDNGQIHVERFQDAQDVVDHVAAISAEGAPSVDGLGLAMGEVPVIEAQKWAALRGIPWEKLLYSNEYDDEFRAFLKEHSKLRYSNHRKVSVQ